MPKAIVQLITNFTVRDGLFLLAALITLLLSLRDGRIQVNVVPLWRIAIQRDVTRVRGKGDDRQITPLPGPLVSDLDGDGLNEIIVVDYRCRLSLFRVRNGVLLAEKVSERDRLALVFMFVLGLGLRLVEEMIVICSSHLTIGGII